MRLLPGRIIGAVVQAAFILGLVLAAPGVGIAQDADGDGIDDGFEAYLAQRFLPSLYYSWTDECLQPYPPRPILFRARYLVFNGVTHTDYIGINYVNLYDSDCGADSHLGDNEAFMVILSYNYGSGDWMFNSVSATAHDGTSCERRDASYSNQLWISKNKHATYTNSAICNGDCWLANWCTDNGLTVSTTLVNVGEPNAQLVQDLSVVNPLWRGFGVWNYQNFYSAGQITPQLYPAEFYIVTPPPEIYSCYDECDAEYQQCHASCDPTDEACLSLCSQQLNGCRGWCYGTYKWDSSS